MYLVGEIGELLLAPIRIAILVFQTVVDDACHHIFGLERVTRQHARSTSGDGTSHHMMGRHTTAWDSTGQNMMEHDRTCHHHITCHAMP